MHLAMSHPWQCKYFSSVLLHEQAPRKGLSPGSEGAPFNLPLAAAQVYLLLSCCPCEGKIAAIVDVPNACCTIAIPTAIFDQVRFVTTC